MKTIEIKEDKSVNWRRDYNVMALNLTDMVFEETSDFCGDDGIVILVEDNPTKEWEVDENEWSWKVRQYRSVNIVSPEYALYTLGTNKLCGYVISE